MKLSYYGRLAYARTIAESAGLALVESDKVTTPCTDGKTMWVPPYKVEWDEDSEEEILWWGKLCHETYHNDKKKGHHETFPILKLRTDAWKKEGKKVPKLWKAASNLFEDLRIEKREYGYYQGQDRIMERLRASMMREAKDFVISNPKKDHVIFMMQWAGFARWNKGVLGEDVLAWTDNPEILAAWDKLKDLMPRVYAIDDVNEPFALADEIYKRLAEDSEDESEEGKGDTESGMDDSEGGGEGEEGESKEGEGEESAFPENIVHDHSKSPPNDDLPKPNEARWKYAACPHSGDFPGTPMTEIRTKGMEKGNSHDLARILNATKTQGLASQIRKELLVLSARRYVGGHKKGKLDSGALWKGVVYRNTEAGKRVFKKKDDTLSLDCAVALLVDQSGSMISRKKIIYASAAACALNDVFDKIGVKCRVSGFTDDSTQTVNYLHKDYSERVTNEELANRLAQSYLHIMSGNADGENILYEYEKLVAREEKKKVMVVLSDGMPATTSGRYDVTTYTMRVISNIERAGKVRLIGVGILDGSVETFYRKSTVIDNAEKIEEVLLNLLRKEVIS